MLAGSYNELCDIWSCGVIMYVLLCGYPPFLADTDPQVLAMVRRGTFTFPQEDWHQVSEDAKDLIKKLLAMKPAERFCAAQVRLNGPVRKRFELEKREVGLYYHILLFIVVSRP